MSAIIEVTDLRDEFVVCRTIGHTWEENPSAKIDGDLWTAADAQAALFLRCVRCHTERFDYYGNSFEVAYRYYRYPEKYRGVNREGGRPVLRGEMFRRSLLLRKRRAR